MRWQAVIKTVAFGIIAVALFIEGATQGFYYWTGRLEFVWWAFEIANTTVYFMAALYALEKTLLFDFDQEDDNR